MKQVKLVCFTNNTSGYIYRFAPPNARYTCFFFPWFQAQAEHLISEIHLKETELERLNASKRLETSSADANAARKRFGRNSFKESMSSDYIVDPHHKPQTVGIMENLQRLMLLRSAFVLYILALHILVFIRISF